MGSIGIRAAVIAIFAVGVSALGFYVIMKLREKVGKK